ncbi:MAG: hypothetical protein LBV16_04040, partial [Elusimicrobiota bacterium]|nr:hypothetical protein [Elusimicrobiota bacterium]
IKQTKYHSGKNIYTYYENGVKKYMEVDDGISSGLTKLPQPNKNKFFIQTNQSQIKHIDFSI